MPPTAWPDVTHYIGLLTKARTRPDRDSIPVCHFHVEEMAQSIHRRELEDTVLVVVGPGIKEPELFSCILCQKDGQPPPVLARPGPEPSAETRGDSSGPRPKLKTSGRPGDAGVMSMWSGGGITRSTSKGG